MLNWTEILIQCGVKRATAEKWAPSFSELCTPAKFSYGFDEIDDFLAQILHESGMLERVEENLNYSNPARLIAVWPRKFKSEDQAELYTKSPEKLANYVYKGIIGNKYDDDGWRFRGRGLIQLTGRDNYLSVGLKIGADLCQNPDLLLQPFYALKSAIAWWEGSVPDAFLNDVVKVSKRVNGGANGLDHRRKLYDICRSVLARSK